VSRVLVLGGSRSGKSAFAESLLAEAAQVDYVATAAHRVDDGEWAQRIAAHRARRPERWRTIETLDLATALRGDGPAVLIDSITLWVAGVLGEDFAGRVDELRQAWTASSRQVVAVSDEVGSGVVPETASGRLFRDALGEVNQHLAATADEVHLVVAGIPLQLR
jgi:adenosylcobinamide kinase/adenosylcobinamide-phosphate guanylyltransferase